MNRAEKERAFAYWDAQVAINYKAMQWCAANDQPRIAEAYRHLVDQCVAMRTMYLTKADQPGNGAWGESVGRHRVDKRPATG